MSGKRVLGIDYGSKRIGLSLSDDTATIAFPHKYILNTSFKEVFKELIDIVLAENIGLIVIGMPVGLKGRQTESSLKIREFIAGLDLNMSSLASFDPVKIEVFDERFSTAQAQKSLISMDVKRKKRKEIVDSVASTLILQSYLDKNKNINISNM